MIRFLIVFEIALIAILAARWLEDRTFPAAPPAAGLSATIGPAVIHAPLPVVGHPFAGDVLLASLRTSFPHPPGGFSLGEQQP